jgi:hypothetical protein
MREGPEHQFGWRRQIEVDGVAVGIEARHVRRRRVPRGHEISRQLMRGQPLSLVEEVTHEWAVLRRGRAVCTLRQNPNGTFSCGAYHQVWRTLEAAAEGMVRRMFPPPSPPVDPGEDAPPSPKP